MSIRVPVLPAPTRLDLYLVGAGEIATRSQVKLLVDAGRVLVDGAAPRKAGALLRGGETIELDRMPIVPLEMAAEDLPLTVLYEDADLVAIDKPAGMVVHPAPGSWRGTVVNALLHRGLVSAGGGAPLERPGIVHRLDKETSGVLLVARNPEAHLALSTAFRDRRVGKVYVAVVLGSPKEPAGVLDWSIGRHPNERQRMSIRARHARVARTRYRVIERFDGLSFVRVEPETGRTHQIRVHLAALGHPVLADPIYGGGRHRGRALPERGPGETFPRQALHAAEISFAHPRTGEPMRLEAPLPTDMAELIERLRGQAGEV